VEELRTGNARLRAELAETTEATARAERASAEARDAEAALRADELNALKKANAALRVNNYVTCLAGSGADRLDGRELSSPKHAKDGRWCRYGEY